MGTAIRRNSSRTLTEALVLLALWLSAVLVLSAASAPRADAAERGKPPQIIRLEPRKMAGVELGKAVVVKGEAGSEPHRFGVEKLSYMMPVAVAVRPVNRGDEVRLKLTKYAWNQPLREGVADDGFLRYVFRTEGEFQISVDAPKPGTPYRMLVWVGDETRPVFAPVVVKASEYAEAKQPGTGGFVMWVIAGALIAIVALLGMLVLRRKSS